MSAAVVGTSEWRVALPRVLPFGVYVGLLALAEPGRALLSAQGLDPRLWYVLMVAAGAIALAWAAPRCEELSAWRMPAGQAALGIAVGVAVLVAWLLLREDWMLTRPPVAGFDPRDGDALDPWWVAIRIAGMSLVVPPIEELFWRSWLMRRVDGPSPERADPRAISMLSLVAVSGAFALEHVEWLAGLVAGLAYGALYRRTASLPAAIVAHAVTNGLLGGWIVLTRDWTLW